jgi:hemerythrin-like metal-binding protein
MQLSWIESLTTVMNLDTEDHKKLFECAAQLSGVLDAANAQKDSGACFDKVPIASAIDQLERQTKQHCEAEELHFFQTGFSCLDSRRQLHLELIDRLTDMTEQFHAATDQQAAMDLAERIHGWAFAHINGVMGRVMGGSGRATNARQHTGKIV